MAKKNKKKKVQANDLVTIAKRELDKGNTKQALKHAKACYRQDRSETTRALLQRAFFMRGKQLHAKSMFENAKSTIIELDELGDVAAEFRDDLTRLRAILGIDGGGSGAEMPDELQQEIQHELADQAVVFGPESVTQPDLRMTAQTVRDALQAAENDEPDRAIELVADIGRDSPFSDWKLFLRGLLGYYDDDDQRMLSNWSRLTPGRSAKRISESLLIVAGQVSQSDASPTDRANVDSLARAIEGGLVGDLRTLRQKWRDPENSPAQKRRATRRFMNAHAKSAPSVARRVAEILVHNTIMDSETDETDLAGLQRTIPTLPLDPHLNRAFALLHEAMHDSLRAKQYWKDYAEDLRRCDALSESQRSTATALVYQRIANYTSTKPFDSHGAVTELQPEPSNDPVALESAEYYLKKSCELDPTLKEVHLQHASALVAMDLLQEATSRYREIARRFSDDFDTLLAASEFFLRQKLPGEAQRYAQAALALRPRDEKALGTVWNTHIGIALEAAQSNQTQIAESELNAAAKLSSPNRPRVIVFTLRTAVAFKEGNTEKGGSYLQDTLTKLNIPPAVLLITHSMLIRCGVKDPEILKDINARLANQLTARKTEQAAGMMAWYINTLGDTGVDYPGLTTHSEQVTAYLQKSTRVKWSTGSLRHACEFAARQEQQPLLAKLAKRGRKLFKRDPYFCYFAGRAEMCRGGLNCKFKAATRSFNEALELSRLGGISLTPPYLASAHQALSMLELGPMIKGLARFHHSFEANEDEDDRLQIDADELQRLVDSMPPELAAGLEDAGVPRADAVMALARLAQMP